MLAPKAGRPRQPVQITANRTPISPHWITWLPGAMFCLFCTVKCAWGLRVVSQEISTADEGDGGQVVVIGR